MYKIMLAVFLTTVSCLAWAQSQSENPQAPKDAMGRALELDAKDQPDTTAPLTRPSPAASPQGETAAGQLAAPDGSSKPVKPKEPNPTGN
jgi:hypothetical protein